MNVSIISKQEVKRLIKEQADKDKKYLEDMMYKLSCKIDDLGQIVKDLANKEILAKVKKK